MAFLQLRGSIEAQLQPCQLPIQNFVVIHLTDGDLLCFFKEPAAGAANDAVLYDKGVIIKQRKA